MLKLKNLSLQTKVVGLNGLIVVAIALGVFWQLNITLKQGEKKYLKSFEVLALSANEALQAQFFERYGDVQAFAMNPQIQARTKSEIVAALDSYVALYGIYDLIIVADLNGKIVGVNSKDPSGKPIQSASLYGRSVADTEWFKNAANGRFTEDKEKAFLGTYFEDFNVDTLVSEVYGEKRPGNSFSTIIKDQNGNPIGVISNRAGARWFEYDLGTVLSGAGSQGFDTATVSLIDKNGVLIAEAEFDEKNNPRFSRDFSTLGSFNLLKNGDESVKEVTSTGKAGAMFSHHSRRKIELASGYSPVIGKKWIDSIGWKVLVRDDKEKVVAATAEAFRNTLLSLAAFFVLALTAAYFFSRSLARQLRSVAQSLTENSREVNQVSQQLAESSNELSASATEQAAALQQTVASIDEVSAMVAKNADNAKRSQEISVGSADSAQKGKTAVNDVIRSIDEINESNQEIVKQVEEGNRQISEIVKVITDIGTKTKVINDIVFQTKLLSFNASVEAARAGEHGKGFAVVAEEVGNLAQMSGNAAKEISQMLDASIAKVEEIVVGTKTRVERLTNMSKGKLEVGTATARRCGEVLEEIVQSVSQVNVMVAEIATASREQAQGVGEINKAMNQLDQVTQANATSSQDAAAGAEKLRGQSSQLGRVIEELSRAVEGHNGPVPVAVSSRKPSNSGGGSGSGGGSAPALGEDKKKGKVLDFPKSNPQPAMKMASGSDVLPSREDSRFEEV